MYMMCPVWYDRFVAVTRFVIVEATWLTLKVPQSKVSRLCCASIPSLELPLWYPCALRSFRQSRQRRCPEITSLLNSDNTNHPTPSKTLVRRVWWPPRLSNHEKTYSPKSSAELHRSIFMTRDSSPETLVVDRTKWLSKLLSRHYHSGS